MEDDSAALNITASIGFNFSRQNCMVVHPTDMHFIWAQGTILVIKSIGKDENTYLKGHVGRISTIACSKSGKIIASGDYCRDPNDLAALIVWDFHTKVKLFRVRIHKQHVHSLSFNCDDTYLISVGGAADHS